MHGPSRVYDHSAFGWTDGAWTGRQLPGSVLYELHVGTFTAEGTFDAAAARLDHLADLGVDLVELLPVASFNGEHNWGYDGVCWYAPHEAYGGPDGLKRFVDAAHGRGIGVVLDVVYNHFGPSGAYAPMFAPYLSAGANPWGAAVNLDGPLSQGVRRYVIDSALAWLRDYHVDGLRLDAVHALVDNGAVNLLEELAVEVDALSTHLNRPLSLIAESDLNDPRLITPREAGGHGLPAAVERRRAPRPARAAHRRAAGLLRRLRLAGVPGDGADRRVLPRRRRGPASAGCRHGRPVDRARTPGHRFVAYLQNHDQIGNRATGDRLSASLSPGLLKIGATLLFTSPFTPMLFMGEEWAASSPWQFFTSHPEPELAAAVQNGRRREFAAHGWAEAEVPDPQDPATLLRSKLDWSEREKPGHAEILDLYRRLIALRRSRADLSDPRLDRVEVRHGDRYVVIRRGDCAVAANLAGVPRTVSLPAAPRGVLLATGPGVVLQRDRVDLPPETAAVIALG
nr:malto-oligosyltrehalose trehalohydrolase [Actinoplanes digitatis]